MLISTALVLLMTPALAFFYGGLVRSKNALNTMMMSFISLGFVGVLWAVVGYSLAFAAGQQLDRRHARASSCAASALEPQGTIPHLLFMAYPGHVRDHHRGADLRRDRRAHALLGLRRVHLRCGRWSSTARSRTGSGAAAGWPTWARSTSPAAPSCTSTPRVAALVAAIVVGKRQRLSVVVAAAAQRAVHAARRRPALVRLVRLQRRQRAGGQRRSPALAFVTTMLAPAATLVVWTLLDAMRIGQADRGRRGHGDRRRPGGDHAGGRLHRPDERDRARRASPRSRATSRCMLARQDRRSTTRSTSSPRTASAARSARC